MEMDWMSEVKTGTTIMAAEFDGGIVIAADSRTTSGAYIVNRVTDKLTRLTDNIYCLRSGSAADTQAVADVVKYNLEFHEMMSGLTPLVKTAAHLTKSIVYNNREMLSAGLIVAGYDTSKGGQVYVVPLGGMISRRSIITGGSGSIYIMGYLDTVYKANMNKQEAIEMAKTAISLAIARDGSSGGCARIAVITKDGVERSVVLNNQLKRYD